MILRNDTKKWNPAREDQKHLLLHSEAAQQLWSDLANLLHIQLPDPPPDNMEDLFHFWLDGCSINRHDGFFRIASFLCGLRALWMQRNAAHFNNGAFLHRKTLRYTLDSVAVIHHRYRPSAYSRNYIHDIIEASRTQIKPLPPKQVRWVKWEPPNHRCKLNTDGSTIDGYTTGGGVVRDIQGKFVFAFSIGFGSGTNMTAEARAYLVGLQLCQRFSIPLSVAESDSKPLISYIEGSAEPPWQCLSYVKKSIGLMKIAEAQPSPARPYEDCRSSAQPHT